MRILKRLINRGNLSTEKERKRMNREEQIESFTKGLSKEELDSFLQQDYSVLTKVLKFRIRLLKEEAIYKDEYEAAINEIVEMTLLTVVDFLENKLEFK